jgi:hypothetical protein
MAVPWEWSSVDMTYVRICQIGRDDCDHDEYSLVG